MPAPSSATPVGVMELKNVFVAGATGVVVVPTVVVALSIASTDPVAEPPSSRLASAVAGVPLVGVNGTLIVSVAERGPAAEGVVVTGTVHSKEKSAFCAAQVTAPAVISGVALKVADAPETVPAAV